MSNVNAIKMEFKKINSSECELKFISDTEGLATTYATLYRRALLQDTQAIAVAGICIKDETGACCATNPFVSIPNVTNSLIELINTLRYCKTNMQFPEEQDLAILQMQVSGKTMLSEFLDKASVETGVVEDAENLKLLTLDKPLITVVGDKSYTLSVAFVKAIGYNHRDKNIAILKDALGESEADKWIVSDSMHHGVLTVAYKSEMQLDTQIVKLTIEGYQGDIEDTIKQCSRDIIEQIESFQI